MLCGWRRAWSEETTMSQVAGIDGADGRVAPAGRRTVRLRVLRQDKPKGEPDANQRWEEFEVEWRPGANVISCLMAVQRNPVTADGKPTNAVVWESNCLEEVCGACTMLINGKVRQACSA